MGMTATGDTTPMPHVATSPTDLLADLAGTAHLDGERLVIDDEAAFRDDRHPRLAWTAAFSTDDADDRRGPVAGLGGEPGARRPVGEHPGAVRGPRSRRGLRFHCPGAQPPDPDLRHGQDRLRGGRGRRRRRRSSSSSPGASRPTRSSVRSTTRPRSSPGRSPPAGAARSSSRATTTSSTPRSTPPTPRR